MTDAKKPRWKVAITLRQDGRRTRDDWKIIEDLAKLGSLIEHDGFTTAYVVVTELRPGETEETEKEAAA